MQDYTPLIAITIISIGIVFIFCRAIRRRKCPKCNTKSKPTGVAGSKYCQYYCENCKRTFFLEHYTNKTG